VADVKLIVEESVGEISAGGRVELEMVTEVGVGPAAANSVVRSEVSFIASALNVRLPHS